MDCISLTVLIAVFGFALTLLFGLHRAQISSKDAEISSKSASISLLEQECKRLQTKIAELEQLTPEVLADRSQKRAAALTQELERADAEIRKLLATQRDLEATANEAPSVEQHRRLSEQAAELGRQIRALTEERQSLRQIALSSNDWLARFVVLEEGRITPMRRQILAQASAEIGLDRVQELSPTALRQAFAEVHARQQVARAGVAPLTKAAMLGLFGVGLVDAEHSLTPLGILALRLTAAYAPRPAERA